MANNTLHIQVKKELEAKMKKFEFGIVTALHYVGNEAVIHARNPQRSRYTDRTGNLTSSIGYVVTNNGGIKTKGGFQSILQGSEGANKGESYAKSLSSNDDLISLIVVAGMGYAPYVEAKGYDVLNSAKLIAEREARKKIQDVINKL